MFVSSAYVARSITHVLCCRSAVAWPDPARLTIPRRGEARRSQDALHSPVSRAPTLAARRLLQRPTRASCTRAGWVRTQPPPLPPQRPALALTGLARNGRKTPPFSANHHQAPPAARLDAAPQSVTHCRRGASATKTQPTPQPFFLRHQLPSTTR